MFRASATARTMLDISGRLFDLAQSQRSAGGLSIHTPHPDAELTDPAAQISLVVVSRARNWSRRGGRRLEHPAAAHQGSSGHGAIAATGKMKFLSRSRSTARAMLHQPALLLVH